MKEMVCGIMRDLEAERRQYEAHQIQIRLAAGYLAQAQIERLWAQYGLESDECMSREAKAIALNGG